jgi:NDP-hexose-3-ketoreductase|uniref:Gfo/Idh/MocA family protein n=1 Tax=Megamonas funiformis TaxID=437897 RepID=UPI0026772EC4|nr:Gfo/Idh/MocA family oxidoreductase [Megamonas funiformis]
MKKIRLGILGTSEIAFRRFLPALKKHSEFEYIGVASRNIEKTKLFVESYGGKGYSSYDELLQDKNIDAVYIPLPPALHFEWGKKALQAGKHILMEKPFCVNLQQTEELIELAKERNLAVHENYMFMYHKQLTKIKEIIDSGYLGKIRLYRIAFGFPMREKNDFRYNKELGGGALLDCGGYTLKLANYLLGDTTKVVCSNLVKEDFEVDLYGNATLQNDKGITAQVSFGMDNAYKCELEVWGSKATLKAPRIFTAPDNFDVNLEFIDNNGIKNINVGIDNQFYNSIDYLKKCIIDSSIRVNNYIYIEKQSKLI